jgi:valyl-tRNA synthetase
LYKVFYTLLQLIAPYLPHITEEIYQDYFKGDEHSIHRTKYPTIVADAPDKEEGVVQKMNTALQVVEQVRRYKSESQISMGTELNKLIISANEEEKKAIQLFEDDIQGITKAKAIERLGRDTSDKEGAISVECSI